LRAEYQQMRQQEAGDLQFAQLLDNPTPQPEEMEEN
jgi:hypothetical protein